MNKDMLVSGTGYILESFEPVTLVEQSPLSDMERCIHRWVFLDRFGGGNWFAEIMACDTCGMIIKLEHLF